MTDPHYKIISLNEAKARGLDYWDDWDEYDDDDYNYGLWFFDEFGGNRFVNQDGGEPEDQTLNRDWSWVAGELNRALEYGMPTAQWDPDDGEVSDDIDNGRTFIALSSEEFLKQLDNAGYSEDMVTLLREMNSRCVQYEHPQKSKLDDADPVPDSAKHPGVFDTTTDADIPTRERTQLDNIEPW